MGDWYLKCIRFYMWCIPLKSFNKPIKCSAALQLFSNFYLIKSQNIKKINNKLKWIGTTKIEDSR